MPEVAPSPALLRFAERQSRIAREFDRRSEARHYFAEPVVVQPVDDDLRPLGDPLPAVTRDVSESGVGLIFDGAMPHDLATMRLTVEGEEACLLFEVLWRRTMEPFEFVGGRVLGELENDVDGSVAAGGSPAA